MADSNQIWELAYDLGAMIADSPEVSEYKRTQEIMEGHPSISPLLNKLRDVQEEYNKLEAYGGGPHLKGLEESIQQIINELDGFSEVVAFKQAAAKVDELLGSVTRLLGESISGKVNDEPVPQPGTGGG